MLNKRKAKMSRTMDNNELFCMMALRIKQEDIKKKKKKKKK